MLRGLRALVFRRRFGTDAGQTGSLQIVGSETMRPVVTACAESFMAENPQADVIVRGGGSGDGMAALLHGMVDIGMISRDLSPKERDYAKSKGIDLSIAELARDGIAIIVHRSNNLAELDFDQLKSVYAGKRTKWRDIAERTAISPSLLAPPGRERR